MMVKNDFAYWYGQIWVTSALMNEAADAEEIIRNGLWIYQFRPPGPGSMLWCCGIWDICVDRNSCIQLVDN